jgi:hypothetical protein
MFVFIQNYARHSNVIISETPKDGGGGGGGGLATYVMPYKKLAGVEFKVLTAVAVKISIFCGIIKCSLLKVNRRLGRICRLHFQGRRISQVNCYLLHAGFFLGLLFDPEERDIFLRSVGWLSKDYMALCSQKIALFKMGGVYGNLYTNIPINILIF